MIGPPVVIPMSKSARDALIANVVLLLASAIFVVLRIYGRVTGPGLGIDDLLAVIALVVTICVIGIQVAFSISGNGYDYLPSTPEFADLTADLEYIMKGLFVCETLYLWALTSLKLSVLLFYRRCFGVSNHMDRAALVMIGVVLAWAITFTFLFIFLCDPIQQQWSTARIGHCMDQITIVIWLCATNITTDLVIMGMPMYTIWHLRMRKTEKLAMASCFALGLACCVIGIFRIVELTQVDLLSNITGTMGHTILLLGLELVFGIMCTNIPMMRPFYAKYRSRKSSSKLLEEPKCRSQSNNTGSHASGARQRIARRLGIPTDQTIGVETALELENYHVLGIKNKALVEHSVEENASNDGDSERRIADSVSDVFKFLVKDKGSCDFAIRSSGHIRWAGASNIEGGIALDHYGLNRIDISDKSTLARVGPGSTWDSIYEKLDPLSRSVAGRRVASVGVGGLTLGGGISHLSCCHG
ncbi:hypothetical protein PFICI_06525 [Pestalotiopsis fici W106-1]|uniref:Uncharacterized protein n=1 Tax=Pestalotiopsis fici (strain W106-1 / CGMCC3.15140) TaxID=1229662 RepID=W3X5W3_PESFW|nr:uncharacterized protein PFICI_06525 [Pestalotiopsis fici W106-1]ETS81523.1 hypothetical protein PFICI_06525 [Pestalotiopsis fici W106-1]